LARRRRSVVFCGCCRCRDGRDRCQSDRRARRTAKLIQAELGDGRVLTYDERLREISIGAWDGLDRDEIAAQTPDILDGYDSSWYFRAPGGETYDGLPAASPPGSPRWRSSVIAVTHASSPASCAALCRVAAH